VRLREDDEDMPRTARLMWLLKAMKSSFIAVRIEEMEWSKFHRLVDDTVTRLRNAEGDREKVESAIRRYLNQGHKYAMSPYILWHYFVISSPGIPVRAGWWASCRRHNEPLAWTSPARS